MNLSCISFFKTIIDTCQVSNYLMKAQISPSAFPRLCPCCLNFIFCSHYSLYFLLVAYISKGLYIQSLRTMSISVAFWYTWLSCLPKKNFKMNPEEIFAEWEKLRVCKNRKKNPQKTPIMAENASINSMLIFKNKFFLKPCIFHIYWQE